jgi:prevent-host-death family protein
MREFNVSEAKARLSQLIRQALSGEDVVIARRNKPLVKLVPVSRTARHRRPGSAKGLITISKEFAAPLKDMKRYM